MKVYYQDREIKNFDELANIFKYSAKLKGDELNVKEDNMKKINTNFKIKDYKVYEDTALIVEFEDGTKEKAVANEDDFF